MESYPKNTFLKYSGLPLTFEKNENVAYSQVLKQNPSMLNEEKVSFPVWSVEWWQHQRLLSKPVRTPSRTWEHRADLLADLLLPFPFSFFCRCEVPSGWTFGKDIFKRHFKKEQKWGYTADGHFVMLEETAQETNAASQVCPARFLDHDHQLLCSSHKRCFGDGYFKDF